MVHTENTYYFWEKEMKYVLVCGNFTKGFSSEDYIGWASQKFFFIGGVGVRSDIIQLGWRWGGGGCVQK